MTAMAADLKDRRTDVSCWSDIKRAYEIVVARRPDSDFYRTFFNSVSRELFGTVGVNAEVEFCATTVGRASGAVPLRVYRVGGSLPGAVREISVVFGTLIGIVFLHERGSRVRVVGAVCVVAGVALIALLA